ncbi:helix-turn-helix transcriptional regulator [Halostella pelagica]|uniref:helix-turn-helix transcriptional regulator n=1 Tax=Halostella pelagica TaxID=2583824 RepID=UPI0010810488|nr:GntR family transcriptional regulator [Halostella pelagica]
MNRDDISGVVQTLCTRHEFLVSLRAGPREKRALVETLDVSRSTVDRAIRELQSEGLVEREPRGFRLSAAGNLAVSLTEAILSVTADLRAAAEVLKPVPASAPIDGRVVRDAAVAEATQATRYRPLSAVDELLAEATQIYGFAPLVTRRGSMDRLAEAVTDRGADAEIVFGDSLAVQLLPSVGEEVRTMVRNGFTPLSTGDLPFGMVLGETPEGWRVRVITYGDDGTLCGVLSNDTPEAATWAWDVYQTYRRDAVDLSPAFS